MDDPFLCIDLDNVSCDMRERFFRDFHDTYIEISQSGKGLHIFAKGEIADNFNNQIEKVEMYQNNRCIAMTGNIIDGISNNIIDKQSEIDRYYECFAPKKSVREQIRAYQSDNDTLPDTPKIIETMCKHNRKAKGLFEALNRSDDRSKRKNEAAYIKYLEDSIKKATQYGNKRYWDYNYHRKSVGDNRE